MGEGPVIERVRDIRGIRLIGLQDDTFLLYARSQNFIIRFDRDFNTTFPVNERVFLIDSAVIDAIRERATEQLDESEYYQYINDEVAKRIEAIRGK